MKGKCVIAEEVAVVPMVSVVLTAPPFGVTFGGLNVQLAPAGNPLQLALLKVTVRSNPPVGVIVIVVVPCCPGEETATVVVLAVTAKPGVERIGGDNSKITPRTLPESPPELVIP